MFAMFCPEPEKKRGFFAKRRFHKKGGRPTAEYVEEGKARYYIIRCEYCAGKLPFERIKQLAGREAGRLVVPEGFIFPEHSGLSEFEPEIFFAKALYYSMFSVLKAAEVKANKIRLGIYDDRARMPETVLKLISVAGDLSVVTDRINRYDHVYHKALGEFGAAITVTGDIHELCGCNVVFVPFGGLPMLDFTKKTVVFSQNNFFAGRRNTVFTCGEIALPREYEHLVLPGFSADIIAAALYERCRVFSDDVLFPVRLSCRGEGVSFDRVLETIKECAV